MALRLTNLFPLPVDVEELRSFLTSHSIPVFEGTDTRDKNIEEFYPLFTCQLSYGRLVVNVSYPRKHGCKLLIRDCLFGLFSFWTSHD